MAVKTFTTGEVLTAQDTNTYLANSGLVYIASSTFTASSAVNITNVLSSTYTQYRVICNIYGSANGAAVQMKFGTGTATTGNTYGRVGFYWLTSAVNLTANAESNVFVMNVSNNGDYPGLGIVDINNPNVTDITSGQVWSQDMNSGLMVNTTLYETSTTAFTSLHFTAASGTLTGTVTVYGYRKG